MLSCSEVRIQRDDTLNGGRKWRSHGAACAVAPDRLPAASGGLLGKCPAPAHVLYRGDAALSPAPPSPEPHTDSGRDLLSSHAEPPESPDNAPAPIGAEAWALPRGDRIGLRNWRRGPACAAGAGRQPPRPRGALAQGTDET